MRCALRLVAMAGFLIAISGAAARAEQPADVGAQWAGYWNAKNLSAALTLYGPEPIFCPTQGRAWNGIDAIRRNFAALLVAYDPRLVLTSTRSEISGDLAYDAGTYEEVISPVKGGKAIHAAGTYLFLFKRGKARHWKIVEQTWTSFEPVKL